MEIIVVRLDRYILLRICLIIVTATLTPIKYYSIARAAKLSILNRL